VRLDKFIARMDRSARQAESRDLLHNLLVAMEIKRRAVENATEQFGKGDARPRYKFGASGALRKSIQILREGSKVKVNAGGPGVPYAAIQEFGGTIVPKEKKWLTIPASRKYRARFAREFNDLFFKKFNEREAALYAKGGVLAYLLRKRVKLEAKPYMRPAMEDTVNDEEFMQDVMRKTFLRDLINVID
jgi:phage gpG-like protein